MQSDDALYASFLTGETQAYDALVKRYSDSLTMYLYGCLQNWQDAEDLMIEAFAKIMMKKPVIRTSGFRAYLFKTARNLAIRFHSAANGKKQFSLEGMEEEFPDISTPDELLQNKEQKKILHLCLDRLEPVLREAIWLIYFEGMKYKEAAAVMKVTEKRVERLLTRGKTQLRTELEKEGITNAFN